MSISRVPYVTQQELPMELQYLLERPIHLYRSLANSPHALAVHQKFGKWVRWECELEPRLREMLILIVGYLTKSPYEFSHHVKISQDFGVTEDEIRQVMKFADGQPCALSEVETIALTAAKQLTVNLKIDDVTWAALAEHFETPRLTDIVLVVSFYNSVVRVLSGLQIEVEPEYEKYLDQFPLD